MTIKDISGRAVKISAHTITLKDENNKTCGLVRGVTAWYNAPFREQCKCPRVGLWGTPEGMKNVFLCDGKWYYLHDLGRVKRAADCGLDTGKYTDRRDAAAAIMQVIDCYIL